MGIHSSSPGVYVRIIRTMRDIGCDVLPSYTYSEPRRLTVKGCFYPFDGLQKMPKFLCIESLMHIIQV